MKIALLSPEYPPSWGGMGTHVYNLAKTLKRLGHEIHVITRKEKNTRPKEMGDNIFLYEVAWTPLPILFSTSFGKNAISELIRLGNNFDIVHVHCSCTSMTSKTMEKINSSIVITMHGTWEGERKALKNESIAHLKKGDLALYLTWPFLENYERVMLTESKAVIAITAHTSKELLSYKIPQGILKSKLKVIPGGIDIQSFKPMGESVRQALREKYRLDKNDLIILSVGRLAARKGFKDLLLAFRVVSQQVKNVKLILVGNGPLEATLKRMVVKLKISDRVIFAKGLAIEELKMHYAGADLFVLPSYYEGQGIIYLEAMASGIPIVATNISAIPETVRHGENGLLVKPGDSNELTDAIIQLLEDEELRIKMGKNGREIAVKEYDWNIIGKKVEEVYEMLLELD